MANEDRIHGEWYWVREGDKDEWFLAYWDSRLMGGRFTNLDTWEDFRDEITQWIHIPRPDK